MGSSLQESMIHWTDRISEMLMVTTEKVRGEVEQHLRMMHSHEAAQTYLEKNPPSASPPIRCALTFRYIVNHSKQCPLSGIHHEALVPFDLGAARLPAQPPPPPPWPPPAPPTVPPPPTVEQAVAGYSADVGGSAMMVDAAKSADVGDSAHAGDSADPWALSALVSVVHLAQSSLPTVDSVFGHQRLYDAALH